MTSPAYPPALRDVDTYPITVAIVQSLLADPAVTGNKSVNGYEGVGTRIYPEANIDPDVSGQGQEFPYLVVTTAATTVPYDYTSAAIDALFDITVVDRAHTPTNLHGGTQNVVPVTKAAQARILNNHLTVTGMTGVAVVPSTAPRGTATVNAGTVYRQRQFTVRVLALRQ